MQISRYPKILSQPDLSKEDSHLAAFKKESNPRKDFWYLIGLVISACFLLFLIAVGNLPEQQVDNLAIFLQSANIMNFEISKSLLKDLKFPNPVSNTLLVFSFVYVSFVVQDTLRKNLEPDKESFKESSSISYSVHILALLLILLVGLFSWKPKPSINVTSIEYVPTQIESKEKPPEKTKLKAEKQSIDKGKHNPQKPVSPVTAGQKAPAKKSSPSPKPSPSKAPSPKATEAPKAAPAPKPLAPISPRPEIPKMAESAPAPAPKPSPTPLNMRPSPLPSPVSKALDANQLSGSTARPLPSPLNYSPNGAGSSSTSTSSAAPKPMAAGSGGSDARGSGLVARLGSLPKVPMNSGSAGGTGSGGGAASSGNPGSNPFANSAPSTAALADADFGPYMSVLERKVRAVWQPPAGSESSKVIVMFKIHPNGTVSDIRVIRPSLDEGSNMKALAAIQKASPFDPLPRGATTPVDIEFSFNYNNSQKMRY